jgi:hypothetical protein
MSLRLHLNRTNYFDKQPKNYLGELVFDEWKAKHVVMLEGGKNSICESRGRGRGMTPRVEARVDI